MKIDHEFVSIVELDKFKGRRSYLNLCQFISSLLGNEINIVALVLSTILMAHGLLKTSTESWT